MYETDEIKPQSFSFCSLCQQIFYDCLEMMREHPADGSKNILVLLLISAVLERSLGNVSTCLIFLISTFIMFAYLLKHDVTVLFSLGVRT